MFGRTEQGQSASTSGNVVTDLKWGSASGLSFGKSNILWVVPLLVVGLVLIKFFDTRKK